MPHFDLFSSDNFFLTSIWRQLAKGNVVATVKNWKSPDKSCCQAVKAKPKIKPLSSDLLPNLNVTLNSEDCYLQPYLINYVNPKLALPLAKDGKKRFPRNNYF